MTLRTVLLSLQALLAAAEPDDPQDAVVAYQYKDKYQLFVTTARHWTNVYAGGLLLSFYYGFQAKKMYNVVHITCFRYFHFNLYTLLTHHLYNTIHIIYSIPCFCSFSFPLY